MNILVMGGTKLFGRKLVARLLDTGHAVTIATRGNTEDNFGDRVQRIRFDRTKPEQLMETLKDKSYDVVYDQICFTPGEAKAAIDALGDRVGRYIFTSTMAVYEGSEEPITESHFDPLHSLIQLDQESYTYAEGKRQAEAYFHQFAPFPVTSVRVSMVIDGDDYTRRFDFHVNHVARKESIGLPEQTHPIAFVTAEEMANFLAFIGLQSNFVGPINAANHGWFDVIGIASAIGRYLNVEPIFHVTQHPKDDPDYSPYAFSYPLRASNQLAESLGFQFSTLESALPALVDEVLAR